MRLRRALAKAKFGRQRRPFPFFSSLLEELLDDYEDFLRVRDLKRWDKDSKEAKYVRRLGCKKPQTYELYREIVETRPPEVIANIAICLIHQADYLLDQQIRRLEKDFVTEGGIRERMTRARVQYRQKHPPAKMSQPTRPTSPRKRDQSS